MNIGMEGVTLLWMGLLSNYVWPILVSSLYIYIKRKEMQKKWLFGVIAVVMCYLVSFAISTLATVLLFRAQIFPIPKIPEETSFGFLKWKIMLIWGIEFLIPFGVLAVLSKKEMQKIISILLIAIELAGAFYLSMLCWLMTAWMIDEGDAIRYSQADWNFLALKRLGIAAIASLAGAGIIYGFNRLIQREVTKQNNRWLSYMPLIVFGMTIISALAGAIEFVLTKPWM